MGGFYKFREGDVEGLTLMLKNLPRASFEKRARMALVCLANTHEFEEWSGVPFFSIGARTLAEKTGETYKSCRKFYEQMERDGWIVRLGTVRNKGGEWTLRTFFWIAEGAPPGEEKGAHRVRPKKGAPPDKSPAKRGAPVRPSPSQNPSSESWAGRTLEVSEETSEEGSPAPDGAAPPAAESALAEIFRMRDDGWEPEWLK